MANVRAPASSPASIVAFSSVSLTRRNTTGLPSKLTWDRLVKPAPLIVTVSAGLPSVTIVGEIDSMAGGGCPNAVVRIDSISFLTAATHVAPRSEEHTSELQSPYDLVCRLLL